MIALLNKLSGFFGILNLFYGGGVVSIISYIYSISAAVFIGYCLLYGLLQDNPTIVRLYSQCYWIDVLASTVFTITFGILWYFVIDHTPVIIEEFAQSAASIADSDKTNGEIDGDKSGNSTQSSSDKLPAWKAEATIAIVWLVVLWLVHIYFAVVVQSYALYVGKKYTNLSSSDLNSPRDSMSGDALLKNLGRRGASKRADVVDEEIEL
ncbi:6932_t:CDS:2 [Paraglomus brasilianum]|uniref:6932_t:CDS:1 n=1 Tax=Paraglomus brasilianum TaxID=144538 RepID=A0A9N9FY88_9GLOM|nr:6932_t:CDS:2 [Paraglomus brasilianum]